MKYQKIYENFMNRMRETKENLSQVFMVVSDFIQQNRFSVQEYKNHDDDEEMLTHSFQDSQGDILHLIWSKLGDGSETIEFDPDAPLLGHNATFILYQGNKELPGGAAGNHYTKNSEKFIDHVKKALEIINNNR